MVRGPHPSNPNPWRETMARPIEATPVLTGKDAAKFAQAASNPKPYTPPTFDFSKMHATVKAITAKRAEK